MGCLIPGNRVRVPVMLDIAKHWRTNRDGCSIWGCSAFLGCKERYHLLSLGVVWDTGIVHIEEIFRATPRIDAIPGSGIDREQHRGLCSNPGFVGIREPAGFEPGVLTCFPDIFFISPERRAGLNIGRRHGPEPDIEAVLVDVVVPVTERDKGNDISLLTRCSVRVEGEPGPGVRVVLRDLIWVCLNRHGHTDICEGVFAIGSMK